MHFFSSFHIISYLFAIVISQQFDPNTRENAPIISTQECSARTGCKTLNKTRIVIESAQRNLIEIATGKSCYSSDGSGFNKTICSDPITCAQKCGWMGIDDYSKKGVKTEGDAISMDLWTVDKDSGKKFEGPRVYLLGEDGERYQFFKLKGKEFSYDVDVSSLPCGLNGALYFVSMAEDGGANYTNNKAGAKYGTGYCDAQCPTDPKFINGQANLGGQNGFCCGEMDIWEANSISTAYTPHVCTGGAQTIVKANSPEASSSGVCDKSGCDFNAYRLGVPAFYGPGPNFTIDTTKKFTVITQFHTDNGSATGTLSEIKRYYFQNRKMIPNPIPAVDALTRSVNNSNSITDGFCAAESRAFGSNATDPQASRGGMKKMSEILDRGMVLSMSMWVDPGEGMNWLDSKFPPDADGKAPGAMRGSCAEHVGTPKFIEANSPKAKVVFSNMKWGDIGSTFRAE